MAKKVRKKGRRKVIRWLLDWRLLAVAGIIIVVVVVCIMSGFNEPFEILIRLLIETAFFYGAALLVALPIGWLIRRWKRTDKQEGDGSPFD